MSAPLPISPADSKSSREMPTRHDDSSMIDLIAAMDLVPGVFTLCRGGETRQAGKFSVSFTLERTRVGFRALELLAWACGEIAYAKQGCAEVKASFAEDTMLYFELCGTGDPRHIASYIRSMTTILETARSM